jgi:chromosome condensin MukBEF MukE localization factor
MSRVLVTGSRTWRKNDLIEAVLADIGRQMRDGVTLVVGGARGADTVAEQVARRLGWEVEVHPADWKRYQNRAGMIRNQEMVDSEVELCLCFIRNHSGGATRCMQMAMSKGIPTWVWRDD